MARNKAVHSILVVRPSAMGDIVMASGLLPALRQAYPQAKLYWLCEPAYAPLLAGHPLLSGVIPWPKSHWRQLARRGRLWALSQEVMRLRQRLRACRPDMALELQGLARSRLLARLSAAPVRLGFDSPEPGRWLLSRTLAKGPAADKRFGSEYYYLLEQLGLKPQAFEPQLACTETARQQARQIGSQYRLADSYAVLAPFTTRMQKHWFYARWLQLGRQLAARGWQPLILGGPQEQRVARSMAAEMGGTAVSLAGDVPLEVALALVAAADLVVGVDTGLTHAGVAFNRPTVAVFGSTCPYTSTPSSDHTRVLWAGLRCSPCKRRPTCEGRLHCMQALTVQQVLAAVAELVPHQAA